MKNKTTSLLIVSIIYIVAFTAAFFSALLLSKSISNAIINLFIADVVATIVVYAFSVIFKNASVYDPYWSVQSLLLVLIYYLVYGAAFDFVLLLVLIPLLAWAVRLTANWAVGFDNLSWMDWRYKMYKNKHPKLYQPIVFFGIMMMPTVFVFLGTVPLLFVIIKGGANAILLIVGGLMIFGATLLQLSADSEMKAFLKTRKKGEIILSGVWKISRHPNYFGEIMVWWGLAIACLVPFSAFTLLGALAITALFVFISIPMMEKHIEEKAPSYSEYKKSVGMLLPFIKPRVKSDKKLDEKESAN